MAVIVSDSFDRANDATSMGTADTGQVWAQVSGDFDFGILSNQAYWNRTGAGDADVEGKVVIDTGLTNVKVSVRLMNSAAGGGLNLRNQGITLRYVDATHFLILVYFNASGTTGFRCYVADGGDAIARANGASFTLVDGDEISFSCCGQVLKAYHKDVLVATTDFSLGGNGPLLSATLLAGTKHGLQASGGIIDDPGDFPFYEDFVIETNLECEGFNWPLPPLQWSFTATVEHAGPPTVTTSRFDAGGLGSKGFLVPQLSDSGDELRDKCVKSLRVTGKLTDANAKVYGHGPRANVDVSQIEAGTSEIVEVPLTDCAQVQQSKRHQINCPNLMMHTVRIETNWDGTGERDRIDEIVMEVAGQGIRR